MAKMKNKKSLSEETEITIGSGNIFADLGIPDPEEHLAKAQLTSQICSLVRDAGLTQAEAAKKLGISQPNVSLLMRGIIRGFSIERLIRFLNILDRDVTLTLRQPKKGQQAGFRVLMMA